MPAAMVRSDSVTFGLESRARRTYAVSSTSTDTGCDQGLVLVLGLEDV